MEVMPMIYTNHEYTLASSTIIQRTDQQQIQQPIPTPRFTNSSLGILSFSSLKKLTVTFDTKSMKKKYLLLFQYIDT